MRWLLAVRIAAAIVLALVLYAGVVHRLDRPALQLPGAVDRDGGSAAATRASVVRVVDGDTITVQFGQGRVRRVRLLGIDAPEVPSQCYAHRAADELSALLPAGKTVTLAADPTQDDVDTYGRLLRYVRSSVGDLGLHQLEVGAARLFHTKPPVRRHAAYAAAQRAAVKQDEGRWGRC